MRRRTFEYQAGGLFRMENFQIYRDIQARTGGDIYIGVVGPVRTGKIHLYPQVHGACGFAWDG